MNKIKSGFIPPVITPDNFVLGSSNALPVIPINAMGDWTDYLPSTERQEVFIETYNCTSFSCLNCFEILYKYFFEESHNFSDRFLGIMAGTKPPGNDPQRVAQTVRHAGLIAEPELPFSSDITSWQEYYSFKGKNETACKNSGSNWLKEWSPGHEYVPTTIEKMREALKYSPLQISVCAWFADENNECYSPAGMANNHATVCYRIDKDGRYYIFDSYGPYFKILRADHDIQFCKRFNLINIKDNLKQQVSILTKILELLKILYAKTVKPLGEIMAGVFSKKN